MEPAPLYDTAMMQLTKSNPQEKLGMEVAETAGGTLILVQGVTPNTPAANVGIRPGDYIFLVNGEQSNAMHRLFVQTAQRQPSFGLTLRRRMLPGGRQAWHDPSKYRDVEVNVPTRPENEPGKPQVRMFSYDYGGVIRNLGPDAAFFKNLGINAGDTLVDVSGLGANNVMGFSQMSKLIAALQMANPPQGGNYHSVRMTILP